MVDFPLSEVNIWCPIYCFALYIILLTKNYRQAISNAYVRRVQSTRKRGVLLMVGLLIITHCLQGDFFSMMSAVHNYDAVLGAYNYGEPFYVSLGLFLGKNYLLFRTVVFGCAFSFFCLTAWRMGVPVYNATIFLLSSFIIIFSYSRASLAMSIYFFGLSFLCNPLKRNKIAGYLIGVVVIWLSKQFHSSATFMIIATVFLFIPINKYTIKSLLFISPLLYLVFSKVYIILINSGGMGEYVSTKIETYNEIEREAIGLSGYINNLLEYLSFYIPLFLITRCMYINNFIVSKCVTRMYKVTLALLFISSLYLFMDAVFIVYFYRILFMTMIPIIIVSSKLYKDGLMSRNVFLCCVIPGIIYTCVKYMYSVYCIIVTA